MFGWLRRIMRAPQSVILEGPGMVHQHPKRCPLNVPGPFYTLGDCMACGGPEGEAPDLLAPLTDGNYTTYFVRQPQSPEEVERACNAIGVCCALDLRYGGTDKSIITRLGNDPLASDYVIREGKVVLAESTKAEPSDGAESR